MGWAELEAGLCGLGCSVAITLIKLSADCTGEEETSKHRLFEEVPGLEPEVTRQRVSPALHQAAPSMSAAKDLVSLYLDEEGLSFSDFVSWYLVGEFDRDYKVPSYGLRVFMHRTK